MSDPLGAHQTGGNGDCPRLLYNCCRKDPFVDLVAYRIPGLVPMELAPATAYERWKAERVATLRRIGNHVPKPGELDRGYMKAARQKKLAVRPFHGE